VNLLVKFPFDSKCFVGISYSSVVSIIQGFEEELFKSYLSKQSGGILTGFLVCTENQARFIVFNWQVLKFLSFPDRLLCHQGEADKISVSGMIQKKSRKWTYHPGNPFPIG
jgi:hypothetical protein